MLPSACAADPGRAVVALVGAAAGTTRCLGVPQGIFPYFLRRLLPRILPYFAHLCMTCWSRNCCRLKVFFFHTQLTMPWPPATTSDRLAHHARRANAGWLYAILQDDAHRCLRSSLATGTSPSLDRAPPTATQDVAAERAKPLKKKSSFGEKKAASQSLSFLARKARDVADGAYKADDALAPPPAGAPLPVVVALPAPADVLGADPKDALAWLSRSMPPITGLLAEGSVDWLAHAQCWSAIVAYTRMVQGDWALGLASAYAHLGAAQLMLRQSTPAAEYANQAMAILKKQESGPSVASCQARALRAAARILSHPTDPMTSSYAVRKAASAVRDLVASGPHDAVVDDDATLGTTGAGRGSAAEQRGLSAVVDVLMSVAECHRGAEPAAGHGTSDRTVIVGAAGAAFLTHALHGASTALLGAPLSALKHRVQARLESATTAAERAEVSACVAADAATIRAEAEGLELRVDADADRCVALSVQVAAGLAECCRPAMAVTSDGTRRVTDDGTEQPPPAPPSPWVADRAFALAATHVLFALGRGAWIGEKWAAATALLRGSAKLYELLQGAASELAAAAREGLALVLLRRGIRSVPCHVDPHDDKCCGGMDSVTAATIEGTCESMIAAIDPSARQSDTPQTRREGRHTTFASDSASDSSASEEDAAESGQLSADTPEARTDEAYALLDAAIRSSYGKGVKVLPKLLNLFEIQRECAALRADSTRALAVNAGLASTLTNLFGATDPRAATALTRFGGLTGKVHAPLFSPSWGVVALLSRLELSSTGMGGHNTTASGPPQIYFSLDGYPMPGERGTQLYSAPITFDKLGNVTVRAIAVVGAHRSGVVESHFTVMHPSSVPGHPSYRR